MNTSERLNKILERISSSDMPISGSKLSGEFGVSRQIIVKDISALKDMGNDIISTTKGYILHKTPTPERILKVVHKDDEIGTELNTIIRNGGKVKNVFVWHKIYGKIEAELTINNKNDIAEYLESLKNGRSSPLKNVTSNYHYHTITADSEATLDKISKALDDIGFLVTDDE